MTSPISAPSSELLNLINLDSHYCARRRVVLSSSSGNLTGVGSLGLPSFYMAKRKTFLLQLQQKSQVKKSVHESAFYQGNRQTICQKRYGPLPQHQSVPVIKSASGSSFSINYGSGGNNSAFNINSSSAGPSKTKSLGIPQQQQHYNMSLNLRHHSQGITRMKFAQGEMNRFAACSSDSNISICTIEYSETLRVMECKRIILLKGHTANVSDLSWSNDNSFLISCSGLDRTLRMWDSGTGSSIRVIGTQSVQACELPLLNNNMVVAGTMDGFLQIINLSTGKTITSMKISNAGGGGSSLSGGGNMVKCMCLSEDGFAAFIGDETGTVHAYALDQMNISLRKVSKTSVTSNGAAVTGLAFTNQFSRDKREPCLLVNGKDNHLRMFKVSDVSSSLASSTTVKTGKLFKLALKQVIPIKNQQSDCIQPCFAMNLAKSNSCTFASGSEDSQVHVYDLPSLQVSTGALDQQHIKLTGHSCAVLSVAFNLDKSIIVSGDAQGTIKVWLKK